MKNVNNLLGLSPELRAFLSSEFIGLPPIRGKWFAVDPYATGERPDDAIADLKTAYDLCVSGRGDGILVFSGGTGTASQTTSYLKQPLTWSKHGITVFGISAPVAMFGRARVSSQEKTSTGTTFAQTASTITRETGSFVTDGWVAGMTGYIADSGSNNGATFTVVTVAALTLTVSETLNVQSKAQCGSCTLTSYNANMITVSGSNNAFFNLHIGNFGTQAGSLGCVKVTGNRNYFGNCHLIGAGHATPGAVATAYDLEINAGEENTFERCVFGTDSVLWAAASGAIRFDGGAWRTRFYNCEVVKNSATAGQGAINVIDATAMSGVHLFKNCTFTLWNENGLNLSTALVIGTKPTSGQILFDGSSELGWSAWGAAGMSGCIYIVNSDATASGAGGIATTV